LVGIKVLYHNNASFSPPYKEHSTLGWDNLDSLRAINSNSVSLIAIYPPFNNNQGFYATPGSVASGAKFQNRCSYDDIHNYMSSYEEQGYVKTDEHLR